MRYQFRGTPTENKAVISIATLIQSSPYITEEKKQEMILGLKGVTRVEE